MWVFSNRFSLFLVQMCCFALLFILCYSAAWKRGNQDRNRVNTGRMKEQRLRGLQAGLLAVVPLLLLSLLLLIARGNDWHLGFVSFYRLVQAPFMALNQFLLPLSASMSELPWLGVAASAILPLLMPCFAGFGYALGYHDVSVLHRLMYATPEAEARHRNRVAQKQKRL